MTSTIYNPVIFLYHELTEACESYKYALTEKEFEDHLKVIENGGVKTSSVEDLLTKEDNKGELASHSVILTFDDGHESNHRIALPVLKKYGFRACFFLTTDWIGKTGYMTTEQIKELSFNGMSIQSHGKTHLFLDKMRPRQIRYELQHSRNLLEEICEQKVNFLSCPGGRYNSEVISCAKDIGYSAVLTSYPFRVMNIDGLPVIGRYGIKSNLTPEKMENLLCPSWYTKFREQAFYKAKESFKSVIGYKIYYRLWTWLIGKRPTVG